MSLVILSFTVINLGSISSRNLWIAPHSKYIAWCCWAHVEPIIASSESLELISCSHFECLINISFVSRMREVLFMLWERGLFQYFGCKLTLVIVQRDLKIPTLGSLIVYRFGSFALCPLHQFRATDVRSLLFLVRLAFGDHPFKSRPIDLDPLVCRLLQRG